MTGTRVKGLNGMKATLEEERWLLFNGRRGGSISIQGE